MKKIFTIFVLLTFGLIAYSQTDISEVTLVVSGDGANKEEATSVALRSAISQTFGVFVSANTKILNDELVKDEIATITSGNIKSYKEISSYQMDNGKTFITLSATVSIGKLIEYSQGKGVECEFAGATFGANLKLLNFNRENCKRALLDLAEQIKLFPTNNLYDYELKVGTPNENGRLPMEITLYANSNTVNFYDYIYNTLYGISISESEAKVFEPLVSGGTHSIPWARLSRTDNTCDSGFSNEGETRYFFYEPYDCGDPSCKPDSCLLAIERSYGFKIMDATYLKVRLDNDSAYSLSCYNKYGSRQYKEMPLSFCGLLKRHNSYGGIPIYKPISGKADKYFVCAITVPVEKLISTKKISLVFGATGNPCPEYVPQNKAIINEPNATETSQSSDENKNRTVNSAFLKLSNDGTPIIEGTEYDFGKVACNDKKSVILRLGKLNNKLNFLANAFTTDNKYEVWYKTIVKEGYFDVKITFKPSCKTSNIGDFRNTMNFILSDYETQTEKTVTIKATITEKN